MLAFKNTTNRIVILKPFRRLSQSSHSHTLSKCKSSCKYSFMYTVYKSVFLPINRHYHHYSHIAATIMTNRVDKLIEERIRTLTVIVN